MQSRALAPAAVTAAGVLLKDRPTFGPFLVSSGPHRWSVTRSDGRIGAAAARGSGLSSLRDRVSVVGGSLAIDSPPGGGTSVRATLPLTTEAAAG